jgi:AcrR family transcriptional regulator
MAGRPSREGRVPRRKSVTQEYLIASAEAGFLERGFHGASVDWLAERAGYTKGAVYSSFGDKAGLFLAVMERRTRTQLEDWRTAAAAPDAEYQVANVLKTMLEDDTFPQWCGVFFEFVAVAIRDPALRPVLSATFVRTRKSIAEALEPLIRRSSMPADEFAKIVHAASNGLGLTAVIEETTEQSDLMSALLSRLQDTEGRS